MTLQTQQPFEFIGMAPRDFNLFAIVHGNFITITNIFFNGNDGLQIDNVLAIDTEKIVGWQPDLRPG